MTEEQHTNTKVIIVDDNATFREGMVFFLENVLNFEVIDVASDGEEFLKNQRTKNADIILMDIEMPKLNGIETIKQYMWNVKECKAIAVTNYEEKAYLTELIGAGFKGCVFKKNIYDELENAIKTVLNNRIYYPKNIRIS